MAIKLHYDEARGILIATAGGRVDLDEFREIMGTITSGERYPATVPALWDLRELDFEDFDRNLALNVKKIRAPFTERGNAPIALVVADQLGYGMMRMLQAFIDSTANSLVCYDYEKAVQWLAERAG